MQKIKVDLGVLNKTIEVYEKTIELLENEKINIINILDKLYETWEGASQKAYQAKMEQNLMEYDHMLGNIRHIYVTLKDKAQPRMSELLNQCDDFQNILQDGSYFSGKSYSSEPREGTLTGDYDNLSAICDHKDKVVQKIREDMKEMLKIDEILVEKKLYYSKLDINSELNSMFVDLENQEMSLYAYTNSVQDYFNNLSDLEQELIKELSMVVNDAGAGVSRNIYASVFLSDGSVNVERVKYLMSQHVSMISDKDYQELIQLFESMVEKDGTKGIEAFIQFGYPDTFYGFIGKSAEADYQIHYKLSPVFMEMSERYSKAVRLDILKQGYGYKHYSALIDEQEYLRKRLSYSGILKGIGDNYWLIHHTNVRAGGDRPVNISIECTGGESNPFNYTVTLYPHRELNTNVADKKFYVFDANCELINLLADNTISSLVPQLRDMRKESIKYILSQDVSTGQEILLEEMAKVLPYINKVVDILDYFSGLADLQTEIYENNRTVTQNIANQEMIKLANNFYMSAQVTANVDGTVTVNNATVNMDKLGIAAYTYGNSGIVNSFSGGGSVSDVAKQKSLDEYLEWCNEEHGYEIDEMKSKLEDALSRSQEREEMLQYSDIKKISELTFDDWDVLLQYSEENFK